MIKVSKGKVSVADLRSAIRFVIKALDQKVSKQLIDDLKKASDATAQQALLDKFAKDNSLSGDDLSDLMYDISKSGFHALKKPADNAPKSGSSKPTPGGKYNRVTDLTTLGFKEDEKGLGQVFPDAPKGSHFYESPKGFVIVASPDGAVEVNPMTGYDGGIIWSNWKKHDMGALIKRLEGDTDYVKAMYDFSNWNDKAPKDQKPGDEDKLNEVMENAAEKYHDVMTGAD